MMYGQLREKLAALQFTLPDYQTFQQLGMIELPQHTESGLMMKAFRRDPQGAPLTTPSGKIEIYSATIAGFGYADCPGHPVWLAPQEQAVAGESCWLIANQPATRLHSQLDFGKYSQSSKRQNREVCCLHPEDAKAAGISEGDIVELYNDRGTALASASLTAQIRRGVIQLPTGAWYDPVEPRADKPVCRHGNPNVLTRDIGTSALAQGCTGQITVVKVRKFTGELPPMQAFIPPAGAVCQTA